MPGEKLRPVPFKASLMFVILGKVKRRVWAGIFLWLNSNLEDGGYGRGAASGLNHMGSRV